MGQKSADVELGAAVGASTAAAAELDQEVHAASALSARAAARSRSAAGKQRVRQNEAGPHFSVALLQERVAPHAGPLQEAPVQESQRGRLQQLLPGGVLRACRQSLRAQKGGVHQQAEAH